MKQLLVALDTEASVASQVGDIRREWETGAYASLSIHVYSGFSIERFTSQIARQLQECFPDAHVVGTMSAGEVAEGKILPRGVLVSALLFEETQVAVRRYDAVKGNEEAVGRQIRSDIEAIADVRGVELLVPGTGFSARRIFGELGTCAEGIQIWGGYSGSHILNAPSQFVFDATGILRDSVLVTVFSGKNLHIDIDKTIGWEPLGLSFPVTKAEGNRLIELGGRPASEIYEKFLQIDRSMHNNAEEGYAFPLLARYNGNEWLRSAFHIEEDGSLNLHGSVAPGMEIQLSYGNPENILRVLNQRLEALRRFKPQVVLLYSCVVRKAFWGNMVNIEMEPFASLCSTAGYHTGGEIMRNKNTGEVEEHNVTLLSIALREGEAPAGALPEVHADDALLRDQASMLRRLTNLIYITMGELQKAQSDLRRLNEELSVMAERDPLTGLYNRRKIDERINGTLDEAAESGKTVSLIMLDVDHFKRVNDVYGHSAGDAVLKGVAGVLQHAAECLGGCAGRWGGEEFFLLLPGADESTAMTAAEGLRLQVCACEFPEAEKVTISLGVITVSGEADRRQVFSRVDSALYQAKDGGRNRTVKATI